ncbi:MAG: glycosyltransferase family 2 protein [Halieaceae bacterium]
MNIGLVIPCLNAGATIAATIDSILEQKYPALDLLVVDGGSADNTMEVVQSYGDQLRWISEADEGQADAINKGLKNVYGEIVKWVNADDVLTPDSLVRVAHFFSHNPDVDFAYGDIEFINMDGEVIGIHREPSFSSFVMIYGHNLFADPASFWRADAVKAIHYLDKENRYSMDYEMWLKLYNGGATFRNLPFVLAQYRIEENNASIFNQNEMRIEHFDILTRYSPWLAKLSTNMRYKLLSILLIVARIYKTAKVFFERREFKVLSFEKLVEKARS